MKQFYILNQRMPKRSFCLLLLFIMSLLQLVDAQPTTSDIKPPTPVFDRFRADWSPQVTMMNRYGTYPVDLSNGLVDISVPLYIIHTPAGLEMPLKLSFHASGLRATEREGLLGLRWALTGLGSVSRIIRGYPDVTGDKTTRNFNSRITSSGYVPSFYDLFGATGSPDPYSGEDNNAFTSGVTVNSYQLSPGSYQDTEYDIFSYSLPSGKSGHFIWKTEDNQSYTGYPMPYEPIKVAPTGITDEDGVQYLFGPNVTDTNDDGYVTTWYLTSIISQNKQDTILINYTNVFGVGFGRERYIAVNDHATSGHEYSQLGDGATACNTDPLDWFLTGTLSSSYYTVKDQDYDFSKIGSRKISRIQVRSAGHPLCEVTFSYDANNRFLQGIKVINTQNNVIRNARFALEKNRNGKVTFLKGLSFLDNNLVPRETYSFDYYNTDYMPECGVDLCKNSDWWGFYSDGGGYICRGALTITDPLSRHSTLTIGDGDKQPRFSSAVMGMIKSITYPTGGTTTFNYESNSASQCAVAGGLRIKSIENIPASGKTETKYYEYKDGNIPGYLCPPSSLWNIDEIQVDCYFNYPCALRIAQTDYLTRNYRSGFPSRYTDLRSNIVSYGQVTEYSKDSNGNVLGKTVYQYGSQATSTELYQKSGGGEFAGNNAYTILHISPENFWQRNALQVKTVYEGEKMVKRYKYDYHTVLKKSLYDLPVYRYRRHYVYDMTSSSSSRSDIRELELIYPSEVDETFAFVHQKYDMGADRLVKETEETYYDNGTSATRIKEIEYDPDYLMPVSEKVVNSDLVQAATTYSYPFSSAYKTDDLYARMIRQNYLTPILEQQVTKDGSANHLLTEYKGVGQWAFYPGRARYADFGSTITYGNYTANGQPIYISRNEGSEQVIYLWSYYQQYPIAEIRNVSYTDVCNALGDEAFVTTLANKSVPSSADYESIRSICEAHPEAQITTAKYLPLVGITQKTDPKGLTTYYEYDALGRLIQSYILPEGRKQVIEQYDYHYTNR
ncbi:MAG: hypothetical protein H6Q13_2578 [Bacteroidetes bacterium]|nr:hypothetical protein [Bacteroidota bacterium]